jgi:tetratricopeptide (TPR) repeat protein
MKTLLALLLTVLLTFPSAVSQTTDTWRSVRTNHLFVIGNADAEKLRQVAAWLEFFHSAFAQLVSRNVIDSSVPTTVVIFRDDASFTPFKPRYQGRPANVAGFFQPGRDVNYIALSLDPTGRDPFSVAFHEYVHVHLRDNVPNTPLWLNEGLAELYGSLQFSGNEALLGVPLPYLYLLHQQELLPLKTLFSIGFNSPHYNEQEKSGIFYGESWALVHYLMLGERGRQEQFKRFLQLVSRGDDTEKAVENAFGTSLSTLEEDFKAYVRRGNLTPQRIASVDAQNYASYTAMQRSSLTDGEANYYLGDLLLHQGRYAEAKNYLSRSVKSAPDFAPAHYQLALLDFITNQDLNEAITLAEKAHKLAPSNDDYSNLLEHLKLKRGDPSAASQAQESLKNAVTSQAVQTGSSSMLGGAGGSVAIHDGRTIDSSGSLPTVDEVLKKYVDALGGVDALKAVTSRVMKGTVDFVGVSRGGSFESHLQAPNKMLDVIRIDPVGTVKMVYNGRDGWTRSVEGLRKLNKAELAEMQRNAEIYAPLKLKSLYAKVSLAGRSKIGYRDVYVLELQPAVGPVTKMYLDVENYLPARIDTVQTWGTTSLPVETYLDDWREVDGVKYAFTFSQSSQKMTLNFTVKEIRHNVAIDSKLFEPPL